MHLRRIAAFLLGAWIIGSLFMAYITAQIADSAAAVLARPPAEVSGMVRTAGTGPVAALLRYQTAEQNRGLSRAWGMAQLVMGVALIGLLALGTHVNRLAVGLCGAMLVMAVFSYFVLAPEINFLGRGLDFASGWSANRARYLALKATYLFMEAIKLGLGCVLAGYVFMYTPRRGRHQTESPTAAEELPEADHRTA